MSEKDNKCWNCGKSLRIDKQKQLKSGKYKVFFKCSDNNCTFILNGIYKKPFKMSEILKQDLTTN